MQLVVVEIVVLLHRELLELLIEEMVVKVDAIKAQVLVVQALLYYLYLQIDTLEQLQEVLLLQQVVITP
tara:strand:+ start:290 stop:496 length:207 start_codon:yes stop_codon:yes gene_type:complete